MSVSFKSVENIMSKARRKGLPSNVTTSKEILDAFEIPYVKEMYGSTLRSNEAEKSTFFKHAYECADFSFCVFSSDDIVKYIEANVPVSERKIFSDATFKVCPFGQFKQLLIVFCELLGYVSACFRLNLYFINAGEYVIHHHRIFLSFFYLSSLFR